MRTIRPLLLCALLLTFPARAQEISTPKPSGPLFQPLLADPLEPQNSLAVNPDTVDYYGSLGGSLEIFRESRPGGSAWSMGFLGEANLEIFRFSWASYRLGDIDLWAGAFVSESEGAFTNRLEFLHGVSHLGDWLFSASSVSSENFPALTAVPWERDGLQYLDSYRAGSLLRLYGGGGFWFSSTPAAPPLYLHAGMELTSGYFRTAGVPWRGYFAYDLQVGEQAAGAADQRFQAGLQLNRAEGETGPGLRLAVTYSQGNSLYGQFGNQTDDHWALGLFFDP